jgi:hypothetical protein
MHNYLDEGRKKQGKSATVAGGNKRKRKYKTEICNIKKKVVSAPVATWSKARMVLDRSYTAIVGSISALSMDVWPRSSVLYFLYR